MSKLGKTKPVIVYENNNGAMKLVDSVLKSNNTLSAHIVKEKDGWFYEWITSMMFGMITPIYLQKRMNQGAHTRSRVTTASLNSPKRNTTGVGKQGL